MFMMVFLGGEVLLRLLRPYYTPDTLREASLEFESSIFARHILKPKNAFVTHLDRHTQFFINEAGYRGPSFPIQKPSGERRIIIIGGSAVFDPFATDAKGQEPSHWPYLVERNLKSRGNENVRVINAGIPGHASYDSLGRLYSQIWMYEPDFVLLYNAWNDIKYFGVLSPRFPLLRSRKPYDSQRNPYISYQGEWDRLFSYSQIYTKFIRTPYLKWKLHVGLEGLIEEGEKLDTYGPIGPAQFRLNVELFVDACRNIGATPILLTQATLVSRDNTEEERKLIGYDKLKFTQGAYVRAFEEIYEIIRSIAKKKDVSVLDLARPFNGRSELFEDAVHTTRKGSEEIAGAVAQFLVKPLNRETM